MPVYLIDFFFFWVVYSQNSDPRSGFATIEKDLGSLTPMLGDRKVSVDPSLNVGLLLFCCKQEIGFSFFAL